MVWEVFHQLSEHYKVRMCDAIKEQLDLLLPV
jgi:hypothetical protein